MENPHFLAVSQANVIKFGVYKGGFPKAIIALKLIKTVEPRVDLPF